jgi:dTDP-4-dehydrorhamnose reductase
MKVLITGAGGFLGGYFAQHLDCDIDARDRQGLDLVDADQVRSVLRSGQYDVVLHCASAGRDAVRSVGYQIIKNNLTGFANLVACRHEFGQLINLATGAEFDIDTNIDCVTETEIWHRYPTHSYGGSKNIIARQVQMLPAFVNLRVFGCFDASESDNRPIKSFVRQSQCGEPFVIPADREFDMFSVADILTVVRAVMANKIHDKDLNLVYNKKMYLSEILKMFASLHDLDSSVIQVQSVDDKNYTGNGMLLQGYDLDLQGLEQSLLAYTI